MKKFLVFIVTGMVLLLSLEVVAQAQNANKYSFGSKTYPGIKPGEMFIGYVSTEYYYEMDEKGDFKRHYFRDTDTTDSFEKYHDSLHSISFLSEDMFIKTKRLGNVAYYSSGDTMKGYRPIFVNEKEYLNEIFNSKEKDWFKAEDGVFEPMPSRPLMK